MRYLLFSSLIIILFYSGNSYASVSVAAPKCIVKGIVLSEVTREEEGRGISSGQNFIYYDLTLKLTERSFLNEQEKELAGPTEEYSCDNTPKEIMYQKRTNGKSAFLDSIGLDNGLVEKCIRGETHFSADGNFMSGHWLYNIEVLNDADCNHKD